MPLATKGYEASRVTVMLCITANGDKLQPNIILNRRTVSKICIKM